MFGGGWVDKGGKDGKYRVCGVIIKDKMFFFVRMRRVISCIHIISYGVRLDPLEQDLDIHGSGAQEIETG